MASDLAGHRLTSSLHSFPLILNILLCLLGWLPGVRE